jgi:hypothetical protein
VVPHNAPSPQLDEDGDDVTVIWNTTSPTGVKSRGNGKDIQLGAGKGITTVYVCADDKDPTNGPGAYSSITVHMLTTCDHAK